MCEGCFSERNPGRVPIRLRIPERETCCYCEQETTSGIYVRVAPDTIPHPTNTKDA